MNHYNVWQLGVVFVHWTTVENLAAIKCQSPGVAGSAVDEFYVEKSYKPMLAYSRRECTWLDLGSALERCDKFSIHLRDGLTWNELKNQVTVLREAIEHDLKTRRFAFVPTGKAKVLDEIAKSWSEVWTRFPEMKEDSERAVDCYALGQDTACVFHVMRVAEDGLRELARKLRVQLTHKGKTCPVEFADWDKVITAAKNKITLLRQLPIGAKRQAQLELYSDAADHCLFMKDIWRNNVSHKRKLYAEKEALAVLERVRGFVGFLGTHFPAR